MPTLILLFDHRCRYDYVYEHHYHDKALISCTRKPRLRWLNELPKSLRLMSPEFGDFQEFSSGLLLSLLGPCLSFLCSYHSFWPLHRPTLQQGASSNHQKAACWQESTSRMREARKTDQKRFETSNHWKIFET